MSAIGEYLVSVTGAALVCSGICSLIDKSKPTHTIIRLIGGIFLMIVIIRPILQLEIKMPALAYSSALTEANDIVNDSAGIFSETQKSNIKENIETYIQEKLLSLNCNLETEITLQDEFPYPPIGIELKGKISPYMRSYISSWLHTELNIMPEDQQWIG